MALFGIAGCILIWLNTPLGVGIGYDSIFYISAADNLLQGLGLSRLDGFGNVIPLTHFPPLYSVILAGASFITGMEIDSVARILASFSFGLLVVLIGWLILVYTRSTLASVLGASLALVSPILIDLSFMAMTEPLFLVTLLLMLFDLNQYITIEKNWHLFIAAGLAAAAYLLRYVGLSVILTGVIALLLFGHRSFRRKFRDMVIFTGIGILPILVYYLRNWFLTSSFTNRVILYHPPSGSQIKQGIATISAWILPARINPSARSLILLLIGLILLILFITNFQQRNVNYRIPENHKVGNQFVLLLGLFIVIYSISLILSITFFDASTRLNDRILSPIYVSGIIAGFIVLWNSDFYHQYVLVKIGLVGIILIFIGINLVQGIDVATEMRIEGKGFSGKTWRSSETIGQVKNLPADTLIYTNEAFAVYYLTGRSASWIPESYDPVKGINSDDYENQIAAMQEDVIHYDGALVIFDSLSEANVYVPIEQLTNRLVLWSQSKDGSIYLRP